MRTNRWIAFVGALAIVFALGSCSLLQTSFPTNADLEGVWVSQEFDGNRATMTVDSTGAMSIDSVPPEVFATYKSELWVEHFGGSWDGKYNWSQAAAVEGKMEVVSPGTLSIQVERSDEIAASGTILDWSTRDRIRIYAGPLDSPPFTFYRQ